MTNYYKVVVEVSASNTASQLRNWMQSQIDGKAKPVLEAEGEVVLVEPNNPEANNSYYLVMVQGRLLNTSDRDSLLEQADSWVRGNNNVVSARMWKHTCTVQQAEVDGGCVNTLVYEYVA